MPHIESATHMTLPPVALNSTISGRNLQMEDDFADILQNIDLGQSLPQKCSLSTTHLKKDDRCE